MIGTVWIVAGAPGAGKSTVAAVLLDRLSPSPALLDKDVLFGGFVREVQRAHGRDPGVREGAWYDEHVKVHEYSGMTRAAAQIRASGCPVLLVAPFTTEIRDPRRWTAWVAELGGDPVRLVWVGLSENRLRERLLARASANDTGKMANWSAFTERTKPATPPPVPHLPIDNDGPYAALLAQVAALTTLAPPVGQVDDT